MELVSENIKNLGTTLKYELMNFDIKSPSGFHKSFLGVGLLTESILGPLVVKVIDENDKIEIKSQDSLKSVSISCGYLFVKLGWYAAYNPAMILPLGQFNITKLLINYVGGVLSETKIYTKMPGKLKSFLNLKSRVTKAIVLTSLELMKKVCGNRIYKNQEMYENQDARELKKVPVGIILGVGFLPDILARIFIYSPLFSLFYYKVFPFCYKIPGLKRFDRWQTLKLQNSQILGWIRKKLGIILKPIDLEQA